MVTLGKDVGAALRALVKSVRGLIGVHAVLISVINIEPEQWSAYASCGGTECPELDESRQCHSADCHNHDKKDKKGKHAQYNHPNVTWKWGVVPGIWRDRQRIIGLVHKN